MEHCGRILTALLLLAMAALPAKAGDDFGMSYAVAAQKKLSKQASVEVEGELRTRNSTRTVDRWSLEASGSYKIARWLKVEAGYQWLLDNNREKITTNPGGAPNNWRPSYWASRHRLQLALTGSLQAGDVTLSVRERWQFTRRPSHTTTRYDFDNLWWEPTTVRGKSSNVLRSRVQIEYNIPHCHLTPEVSVELFNDMRLDKTRVQLGGDYKITRNHIVGLFYRYQNVNNRNGDNEPNMHMLGLTYKFKF